jgi:DNA-binding IclR family transcriptional regulator
VSMTSIVKGAGPQVTAARRTREDEGGDRNPPEHTVLGRSAAIMEAFNCAQPVLSLADLNKRTRLPKSTLHRLVDQLCQVGWLERDHGGYRVGLRMFEFGTLAVDGNRLHEAAFPHLQALASRTGLAAQLAILDHAEVVYLERIVVGPIRLPTRRGGRKPAYCTALGKAMAAYDDDAIHAVIAAPMPRKTATTITEPVALWTELKRVREAGVAFDRGEAYEELMCVAAPIRSSGRAIAAVSVTGPAGRMRWNVVTEAVRSTAAAIWNANLNLSGAGATRRLPAGAPGDRGQPVIDHAPQCLGRDIHPQFSRIPTSQRSHRGFPSLCRQSSVLRPSAASSRSAKKTRPVYSSGFSQAAK